MPNEKATEWDLECLNLKKSFLEISQRLDIVHIQILIKTSELTLLVMKALWI